MGNFPRLSKVVKEEVDDYIKKRDWRGLAKHIQYMHIDVLEYAFESCSQRQPGLAQQEQGD